jgi:hypothetical protein
MSNYVKSTNFASKDSLATGNPLKIVKGTEIDTEFNNIATAVATKADLNSPTFLGTPVAPTASAGTNDTQIATTAYADTAITNERTATATLTNKTLTSPAISSPTITGTPTVPTAAYGTNTTQAASTAFVQAALSAVYPVGSIYINAGSSTNPATLLGFGTWVEFGAGKVLVGLDASDSSFDTLEETGGSKDAIVVSHTHTASSTSTFTGNALPSHTHTYATGSNISGSGGWAISDAQTSATGTTSASSGGTPSGSVATTTTVASTGSSGTNANLQPYVVVKMWKRTA